MRLMRFCFKEPIVFAKVLARVRARATCPNVFVVKTLRESGAIYAKEDRKTDKTAAAPGDTRDCSATELSSPRSWQRAILFRSARTANRLCEVSPLQAGREFATRQRDEYETDCFTIPATNAPPSLPRYRASPFAGTLNLVSTRHAIHLRIDALRALQIDPAWKNFRSLLSRAVQDRVLYSCLFLLFF